MKPYLPYLATALALSSLSQAATINWGSAITVSGDADVSTNGTLDRAFNFTDVVGSGSISLNGVVFTNQVVATTTSAPASMGSYSISTAAQSTTLSTTTFNATGTNGVDLGAMNSLSASYKAMLGRALVSAGTANYVGPPTVLDADRVNGYTVTLSGLTPGTIYELQMWVSDSRTANPSGNASIDGAVAIDYNSTNAGGGLGQYVTGTFQADATTQSFGLTGIDHGGSAYFGVLNAFQLRSIPEPSHAMLGAIAMIGGLGIRRRH
jgi:hypothetical protein